MAAELHSPTPEELMAYLDGEGTASSRAAIDAHMRSCAVCQALADDQRGISRDLAAWTVAPVPSTLRAPAPSRTRRSTFTAWLRQPRAAVLTLSAVAALLVAFTMVALPLRQT